MFLAVASSHFSLLNVAGIGALILCAAGKQMLARASTPSANWDGARGEPHGPGVALETSGAFACPGCGAVLHDLTAENCPYCGAAFGQTSAALTSRLWRTDDYGATWTIVERTCPGCGGLVADSAATRCPKCGQPLPALAPKPDPRPSASIRIDFPPMRRESGKLWSHKQFLERYLECHHWPVPPPVPRAIAKLLRPLPDKCPPCSGTVFNVALRPDQEAWEVVCAKCGANPGVRSDAD
jgi:hypothetical protein